MKRYLTLIGVLLLGWNNLLAQEVEIDLLLRPRFESRAGYKTLRSAADKTASFISQRSLMGGTYHHEKLTLRVSAQHSGTWGQEAGSGGGTVGLFEAYGRYEISDDFALKAGRQILSYDNERIFGSQHWTLTGRSHDALLVEISPGDKHMIHAGIALNNSRESLSREVYSGNYKSMQYLWYHYQAGKLGFSALLANVGYEQGSDIHELSVANQQTMGTYIKWSGGPVQADGAFYRQSGSRGDKDLEAYYTGGSLSYTFPSLVTAAMGFEYLSGNGQSDSDKVNRAFMPLFGSNHAFNGHMDYFYVGNHMNTVGLKDIYGKLSAVSGPLSAQVSPHIFYAASEVRNQEQNPVDRYLGTEVDLSAAYKIDPQITLSAGYSRMFGSQTLELLRGGDRTLGQHWAWLSISFSPKIKIIH